MREPSDYSTEFADQLRTIGLRPVLIGALAAGLYRRTPRFTTDVDFLVDSLDGVADRLRDLDFEVHEVADESGVTYLLTMQRGDERADVLAAETDYQRQAIERAQDGVLTVEDVIVHKLIAWRPRDRDDLDAILQGAPDVDLGYVEEWVRQWEVEDRWDQVKRRFGLDPRS